ncbi:MAG: PTS fructose transporter subunit IIA [Proteobacteria bacterium]|nr:PTS fructose transporter subunit IIA [Pseudomonadota bacterium]
MIEATAHVLGYRPEQVEALPATYNETPESLAPKLELVISRLDKSDGVLVLTDLYGTTHTNVASRFIDSGNIEMLAGLNMSMLIRAITYRNESMSDLIRKVTDGGREGIRLCSKLDNYKALIP